MGLELGSSWKSFKIHNRKSLDTYEQTVARNMDIKGDSGEVSETRNILLENRKNGELSNKMAKNLAKLCSSILRKVELVSNEIGYLAERLLNKGLKERLVSFWLLIVKCKGRKN